MSKNNLRFQDSILSFLKQSDQPVPYRKLALKLLGESSDKIVSRKKRIHTMNGEKNLERDLRELVKKRLIDRLPGNLFRIRPQKEGKETSSDERSRNEGRNFRSSNNSDEKRRPGERGKSGEKEQRLPKQALLGIVSKNSRGFAFVAVENPPTSLKDDVFLAPDEAEGLMSGDKVAIVIDHGKRSEKGPSGKLVKIMERGLHQAVGSFAHSEYMGPSVMIHNKQIELRVFVDQEPSFRHLKDGSAVLVEVTHIPKGREAARGRIISVLADSLDATTDDLHIITKHKLKSFFPEQVVADSAVIPQQVLASDREGRKDLRELPFITIDGADARDFDDAVCGKYLGNGQFRLWVAVADVAHYVRPGTALDKEAYERATSVYFPHRVLPMLPERLSNGICSLNPHEDRLAMVCEMDFNDDGTKIRHKVYEAVFHSQKRCVYENLQDYIDKPSQFGADYPPAVQESISALYKLYKLIQAQRVRRGSIDLELPENKVIIGKKGEVLEIKRLERKDTHRLIEEFMIAANEAVSEIMESLKLDFIFRVHETPDPEAFQRFMDLAQSFGLASAKGKNLERLINPKFYQELADSIKDSPAARVLHFQLLRSMKQAFYSNENLEHFGLASRAYTHFTSPIRRYPDLIVHRLLKAMILKDKQLAAKAQGSVAEDLASAAQHCSTRERAAADAEREMIRVKQVRYAEAHLGQEFSGIICGLNQKGIFVELQEVSLEGMIPMERLGNDIEFNERNMSVRIARNRILKLGDPIRVQIVKANPHLLQIDLEPLEK